MIETVETRGRRYRKFLLPSGMLLAPGEDHAAQIDDATWNVHAYVLAPAITAFTSWLLKSAASTGTEVLYFLARDGYLPYLSAKSYCERYDLPISCRYLHCSRYSLRVPLYHKDHQKALEYICRRSMDVTFCKILCRSGFQEEQIQRLYPLFSDQYSLHGTLNNVSLKKARKDLASCPEYLQEMDQTSRAAFPLLCGYFEQEGLLEGKRMAIVDSGWTGTIQQTINEVLRECGQRTPMEGYYFGLYQLPENCCGELYHAFYFSPWSGLRRKIFFSNCLFETILSAPEGTTIGYTTRQDGRYVPVLQEVEPSYRIYFERLRRDLERCDRETAFSQSEWEKIGEKELYKMSAAVSRVLRLFMTTPLPEEASWFGSFLFSDDLLDDHPREVAEALTERQLTANHFGPRILRTLGLRKDTICESAWLEGSIVRNGMHQTWHRLNYEAYKLARYLRKH